MAKAREILGFNDIPLMLIGIPLFSLILPVIMPDKMMSAQAYPVSASVAAFFVTVFWISGRTFSILLRKRFPRIEDNPKRITALFLGMTTFIGTVNLLCKPLIGKAIQSIAPDTYQSTPTFWPVFIISMVLGLAILGIYESVFAINNWKATSVEAEQLRKENVQAQLDSLKNQVNPHFLFNSLNTVTSLIHDEPDLSVEFIQKLSKTYRYILEIRDRELISLEEELKCIESYQFLLEIRFGEAFQVKLDIPPSKYSLSIIPLSLQMLLENAIKHNIVSKRKPLLVEIMADEDRLIVRNNLQRKENQPVSTQTGLENIRRRYKLLTGREIEIREDESFFTVTLPLIELQKYESADH